MQSVLQSAILLPVDLKITADLSLNLCSTPSLMYMPVAMFGCIRRLDRPVEWLRSYDYANGRKEIQSRVIYWYQTVSQSFKVMWNNKAVLSQGNRTMPRDFAYIH